MTGKRNLNGQTSNSRVAFIVIGIFICINPFKSIAILNDRSFVSQPSEKFLIIQDTICYNTGFFVKSLHIKNTASNYYCQSCKKLVIILPDNEAVALQQGLCEQMIDTIRILSKDGLTYSVYDRDPGVCLTQFYKLLFITKNNNKDTLVKYGIGEIVEVNKEYDTIRHFNVISGKVFWTTYRDETGLITVKNGKGYIKESPIEKGQPTLIYFIESGILIDSVKYIYYFNEIEEQPNFIYFTNSYCEHIGNELDFYENGQIRYILPYQNGLPDEAHITYFNEAGDTIPYKKVRICVQQNMESGHFETSSEANIYDYLYFSETVERCFNALFELGYDRIVIDNQFYFDKQELKEKGITSKEFISIIFDKFHIMRNEK